MATTQPNGRFATALDPGASREVRIVYRFNNRILEKTMTLDSTVVPSLRTEDNRLRNGSNARFRGELPGPNAGARTVALQAKVGRKWRTFKTVQTDDHGSFRGLYRFIHTTITTRYTFRAAVSRQGGYPYEAGASRKRKILVRG